MAQKNVGLMDELRNCTKWAKKFYCFFYEVDDVEPHEDPVACVNPISLLFDDVEVSQYISSRAIKQTGGGGLFDTLDKKLN